METWFLVLISLCLSVLLKATVSLFFPLKSTTKNNAITHPLPPGPFHIPIITSIAWLRKSFSELEPILRNLHAKHGPILTLRIGSRPAVFVSSRTLAHQALVQNGAVFSNRPKALPTSQIMSCNQHNISSAFYGPTWRVLRRNLTAEMLHPSRVKSFSGVRKWVLDVLLDRLKSDSESNGYGSVRIIDHLRYAMFCLLVFMCFGEKVDDKNVKAIERVQRSLLLSFGRFNILNFLPRLTRILLSKRWEEFLLLRKEQEAVLTQLIRSRKQAMENRVITSTKDKEGKDANEVIVSYVDTLLNLELPEEKRKLNEGEMVSLCSEFLDGGTDTTSTALQWIMANLVKYPHVQERLLEEIRGVMDDKTEENEVREEDLQKLPYLKAVILEGLRRHPPGHFVLPHAVSDDVVLDGYLVPRNGTVNFMVADMGWDPQVWEDPMSFKPERFLNGGESGGGVEAFDITGSKEIRMMPFGAGRRICPGYNLAMLHLEYFVANLVWNLEWKAPNGVDVDLSEKQEFTMVMKHPLQALISPRINTHLVNGGT